MRRWHPPNPLRVGLRSWHSSIFYMCSCEIRRQDACTAAVDYFSSFLYGRTHHVSYQRNARIKYSRAFILSSIHHVLKVTSSADNTLVPDLLPLPSTIATHVHVRVANLLGSFYELSTLKLIYTGSTAVAAYICCILSDSCFLHTTTD